jgi:pyruvate,water dikinase
MTLFFPVTDARAADPWQGGESAWLLYEMARQGLAMLPSWVLPHSVFEQTLHRLIEREPVFADWPQLLWESPESYDFSRQYLARRLHQTFMALPLDQDWQALLEVLPGQVVRIMPSVWAGEACPTAGLVTMLKGAVCWAESVSLEAAMKSVWSEILSAHCLFWWEQQVKRGLSLPEKLGVGLIIQAVVPWEVSGTLTVRSDRFHLEVVQGLPEAIAESCPAFCEGDMAQFLPWIWQPGYQEQRYQVAEVTHLPLAMAECFTVTSVSTTTEGLLTPEMEQILWNLARHLKQIGRTPLRVTWGIPMHRTDVQISMGYRWSLLPAVEQTIATARGHDTLVGYPAAPGEGWGTACVIQAGEPIPTMVTSPVVVAREVLPEWLPWLKRAIAIVSERGGLTSHAAVLARELGLPAVVGVADVTQHITSGMALRVDGDLGVVEILPNLPEPKPIAPRSLTIPDYSASVHLWLNLSQPENAELAAALPVAGIGLLRSEWLMLPVLEQRHPYQWVAAGGQAVLRERLVNQLRPIVAAFRDRPVRYRTLDIRSHEFAQLQGAPEIEANPMLGMRGALSYQYHPAFFDLELAVLKRLQDEGYTQLQVLLPFVRTVEELTYCQERIRATGLDRCPTFQVWMMAEVPSVLFLLPQYAAAGIHGIAIGTHDLTQLLLGIDRDQSLFSDHLDESHPAVQAAIAQLIEQAAALQLDCCLYGLSVLRHPEFVKRMVSLGLPHLSVDLAVLESTLQLLS